MKEAASVLVTVLLALVSSDYAFATPSTNESPSNSAPLSPFSSGRLQRSQHASTASAPLLLTQQGYPFFRGSQQRESGIVRQYVEPYLTHSHVPYHSAMPPSTSEHDYPRGTFDFVSSNPSSASSFHHSPGGSRSPSVSSARSNPDLSQTSTAITGPILINERGKPRRGHARFRGDARDTIDQAYPSRRTSPVQDNVNFAIDLNEKDNREPFGR